MFLSIFLIKKSFYDILYFIINHFMIFNHSLIRQSIFLKIFLKELFRKNAISQDPSFVSISLLIQLWRRKRIENLWNEKCLQAEIKTLLLLMVFI